MIGRNSVEKIQKILNAMQKTLPENSLTLPRNRQNTEMISFSYDVNDHVYAKSKTI